MIISDNRDELRRATLAISCRDAELVPKVPNAGAVETIDGNCVQIMHNGLAVLYGGYHGDWMANIIHGLRGHHEPQEEKVFSELMRYCRPKSCVLELGAFWAYYSMWYLRDIPFSTACCVEPDTNHIDLGRRNMQLNGLHADFLQAFVGETGLSKIELTTESGERVAIPQHTVESLMDYFAKEEIELLHADIQGAELGVIKSCAEIFAAKKIRFVVVSTHHVSISGSNTTHADCLNLLTESGGHILCEHEVDESFSGDGLIAAAMWPEDRLIPKINITRCRRPDALFFNGY